MKTLITTALVLLLAAPPVGAHGDAHAPGHDASAPSDERHAWGRQGEPAQATRTVRVTMSDTMRFDPAQLQLRRGETVTFVVHNAGQLMHEFVIGTEAALAEHAELMKQHPGMEHEAPYMAHVGPGGTQRISWTFTEPGRFLAGCLLAGHWDAGMKASLDVRE